jgi:predicted esterase
MSRTVLALFAVMLIAACQTTAAKKEACVADNLTWVRGGEDCLAIKTFGHDKGATTLVVFIHGDGSGGGASDYLFGQALRYGKNGTVAVGLIRPGYYDSLGNTSTGQSYRENGDGYRAGVVDAVALAVTSLKEYHGVQRVVLVGHSGGAAISGIILGRYPGLADAAVLAACPCNVPDWRVMRRGTNTWTLSQSPHEFADAIPATTRVIAVTGSRDSNTQPVIARDYIESLRRRGLDATYVDAPGTSHNTVTRTDEFYAAIDDLLK